MSREKDLLPNLPRRIIAGFLLFLVPAAACGPGHDNDPTNNPGAVTTTLPEKHESSSKSTLSNAAPKFLSAAINCDGPIIEIEYDKTTNEYFRSGSYFARSATNIMYDRSPGEDSSDYNEIVAGEVTYFDTTMGAFRFHSGWKVTSSSKSQSFTVNRITGRMDTSENVKFPIDMNLEHLDTLTWDDADQPLQYWGDGMRLTISRSEISDEVAEMTEHEWFPGQEGLVVNVSCEVDNYVFVRAND